MNKKADITITLLVIGVFVVCALAMITFFLVSLSVTSNFADVGLIEKINLRMEKGDVSNGVENFPDGTSSEYLKENRSVKEYVYWGKDIEVFYVKYFK